jgi:hypothetical protein
MADVRVERGSEDLACRPVEDGGDTCRGGGCVWSMLLASGFGDLGLKTIGGGFTGLGLKIRVEVLRWNGRHVVALGSSHRGEATGEETRWPSDEDDTGLDCNALRLSGVTHLYPGAKLGLCNSPVKYDEGAPISLTSSIFIFSFMDSPPLGACVREVY